MFDGLISGVLDFIGGERRNDKQEELAQGQMDFQERMSSTAHQREVNDLVAAGLNPMLSTKYGGSSTPQGAMATVENTMGRGVATAMQGALNRAMIDKAEAETENTKQQTNVGKATERNIDADTMYKFVGIPKIEQDTQTSKSTEWLNRKHAGRMSHEENKLIAETDRIVAETKLTKVEEERMHVLVQNAIKEGRLIDARSANYRMQTAIGKVNEQLLQYEIPKSRNIAGVEETSAWKKNVAPFLIDAQRIGTTAGSIGLRHR